MSPVVRPATDADLPALVRIHLAAYAGRRSLLSELGEAAIATSYAWFIGNSAALALVALVDDQPQGFLVGHHEGGERAFARHRQRAMLGRLLRRPDILLRWLREKWADRGVVTPLSGTTTFYSLAVAPDHHGRKLGNALLAAGEAAARTAGARHVEATVGNDNLPSLFLYRVMKYAVAARLPGTAQLLMRKTLA